MQVYKINRMKAEAPLMALFFISALMMSLALYPRIMWYSFLVFPLMAISYYILSHFRLGLFKRQTFLLLDDEGMRYCFNVFQQPKLLEWKQVERVTFQMYEINFRLKESGNMLSIPITYLQHEEDIDEIRVFIESKCTRIDLFN